MNEQKNKVSASFNDYECLNSYYSGVETVYWQTSRTRIHAMQQDYTAARKGFVQTPIISYECVEGSNYRFSPAFTPM